MEKQFRGVYTAMVTPFTPDGAIDWAAYEHLIELQIAGGVAGVVPCGTTGESPTLSHAEQLQVIERTVTIAQGRCQVIGGTGSNSTADAIAMSQHAEKAGVDGCLVVNPYYNKPTQEGLYRHFTAIAKAVKVPVIVYNIKGRTAVNIDTPTLVRMIQTCDNILGDKEASGDLAQMRDVIQQSPEHFCVLSGDDNMTYQLIRAGGDGVVSVASNLIPEKVVSLVDAALNKDWATAEAINTTLMPCFEGLFLETNPIPVKAALAMKGLCAEAYRLPMCEMQAANRTTWQGILEKLGLL